VESARGPCISQNDKLACITKIEEITNIKDMPAPKDIKKMKISSKLLTEVKKEPIIVIKKRRKLSLLK